MGTTPMKAVFFSLWLFVFSVTVYDVVWTVNNNEDFQEWEVNPVARLLVETGGIKLAIVFRLLTIIVGCLLVCFAPRRTSLSATLIVFLFHLYLFGIYSIEYLLYV